jgi:hypothetical protein
VSPGHPERYQDNQLFLLGVLRTLSAGAFSERSSSGGIPEISPGELPGPGDTLC